MPWLRLNPLLIATCYSHPSNNAYKLRLVVKGYSVVLFLRQGYSMKQSWLSWNSLYRPSWPRTYRGLPASCLQMLGSQVCTTTNWSNFVFKGSLTVFSSLDWSFTCFCLLNCWDHMHGQQCLATYQRNLEIDLGLHAHEANNLPITQPQALYHC